MLMSGLIAWKWSKAPGCPAARRQLDCAGVVTTVLAACQRLARQPAHEDLLAVRFQVPPGNLAALGRSKLYSIPFRTRASAVFRGCRMR